MEVDSLKRNIKQSLANIVRMQWESVINVGGQGTIIRSINPANVRNIL
jgi:hypothetical protein